MTALHQAGRWKEVLAAAEKLARLDPDHPDPGGIVSDAQANIGDAALAEQYAQALNHLDRHRCQQAAELFTAIEQQQPGYRDAAALVKDAEQQRHLAAWLDQAKAAAGREDWDAAVTALENLCAVDPAYRGAGARLERARSARSVKQLPRRDDRAAPGRAVGCRRGRRPGTRWPRPRRPRPGRDRFRRASQDRHAALAEALAEQYAQALNHLDQHHWQQAAELFTAIEQQQPGYRDVAAALVKDAEQQQRLAAWLDQAKAAAGQEDWDAAVTALKKLCAIDPAYRDAAALLERARSARSVKQLVDEMTALHQAGRWKEVLAAAEKLARLDPEHPDPGGIALRRAGQDRRRRARRAVCAGTQPPRPTPLAAGS